MKAQAALSEQLAWLYDRQRFGMHPGLTRVQALLARVGNPQQRFATLLIGGTNGKGSTAATLAAMLNAAGRRTGLFTSPHLTRFSERFVVDGQEVSADQLLAALQQVRPHAEEVEASFFEIVVALGCCLFAAAGVQWAVMEVGLGGRLDATNALEPRLSVITGVALDHTEVLGESISAIAAEKAGILRPGAPAVTGAVGEALSVLQAQGAELWALDDTQGSAQATFTATTRHWQGWQVQLVSPAGELNFRTPLLGLHGARNAALAALAAQRLGLPATAIAQGAAVTQWPGRLELLSWNTHPDAQARQVLLDGAHNPDGAAALVRALRGLGVRQVPLVFGAAADKDLTGVSAALREVASQVILTRAALSPRAAEPANLQPYFAGLPTQVAASPQAALEALPPGLSVACGSLYLLGELRPLLRGETGESGERWQ